MTIDKNATSKYIASIKDSTGDIQGKIDENGVIVKVPYTATSDVTLLAFTSDSVMIIPENTEDSDSGITATLQWDTQAITEGSGIFDAKIIIDDSTATTPDNTYLAKKLRAGDSELEVASFKYALDDNGTALGTLTLKIIHGILDRNFNVQTNGEYEHRFIYLSVTNPNTRKTWLNNNLGAEYADINSPNFNPAQQATTGKDYKAYGSLFQWGRKADGHELIDRTNKRVKRGATDTKSNDPTDALFIKDGTDKADWRVDSDETLWANETSANNVCPKGYRLPTGGAEGQDKEWELEVASWSDTIKADVAALESTLKLTMAGIRDHNNSNVMSVGNFGDYWSANPYSGGSYSHNLVFNRDSDKKEADGTPTTKADVNSSQYYDRVYGYSVRCIKD